MRVLLFAGAAFAFAPEKAAVDFAIATTSVAGMGTLRADLGGTFLVLGVFTLLGVRPGKAQWLLVPLAFMGAFLVLRLFHLAIDGISPGGMRSTAVEVVLLGLLAWGQTALATESAPDG